MVDDMGILANTHQIGADAQEVTVLEVSLVQLEHPVLPIGQLMLLNRRGQDWYHWIAI